MAKVFIEPIGVTIEVDEGSTLLEALVRAGVDVQGHCAGRGTCGKCLVRLGAGELSPPTAAELARIPEALRAEGWRLACQAHPASARVSLEVRAAAGRRRILTASRLHHGAARPAARRLEVALAPPTLADPRPDAARLRDALAARERPLAALEAPLPVLSRLAATLREADWRVAAVVHGRRLVDVAAPGALPGLYGAAVDVGTSKVIVYLFDLERGSLLDQEAVENPQMRYGEDVVSRIAQGSDPATGRALAAAVREAVDAALAAACERQGVPARTVCDMTVVGNTAMHHLFLGLSPVGLGQAPFAAAVAEPLDLRAADLGLTAMNPEGGVHLPPPIAGFVGSDALAVIAATRLAQARRPALAIDIGTNTEVALARDGEVTVTSCASGPAFEGYQIRHGMKAVAGAIERVEVSRHGAVTGLATIASAPPVGICGSGVVDLLAGLVRSGVVDASGRMKDHPLVRQGEAGWEYVVASGPQGDIVFTQQDVRSLQLAKAAIASGWELLLDSLGVPLAELDRVYVAGAFGNYLDLEAAQFLGLLPPLPKRRVAFVGNAAGVGAQMALVDVRARRRMARLRTRIRFLDLATDPRFLDVFSRRLGFAGD